MSHSPLTSTPDSVNDAYLSAWQQLAKRIQRGQSFSGRERNCFFLNTGTERFADASAAMSLDHQDDSRSAVLCDWDGDGDLDLWLTNRTGPRVRLLENRAAPDGSSLRLRLRGAPSRDCPLDAVGSRVRLRLGTRDGTQQECFATVTFGDGFLSQSEPYVHFGLPREAAIVSVSVRWAGTGRYEELPAPPGGWKRGAVVQVAQSATDDASVVRVQRLPIRDLSSLESNRIAGREKDEPSERAPRLWLSSPRPVGTWSVALEGQTATPLVDPDRPTLVIFWASWCGPCLAELDALSGPDNPLRQEPIRLLALNVERAEGKTKEEVLAIASRIMQPFGSRVPWAAAPPELVDRLDTLRREAIYRDDPLPLPVSFLLDREGRLRAVYTGPIDEAVVHDDLRHLDDPRDRWRERAVPFPGRWAEDLFVTHPLAIAGVYRQEGQFADAHDYLDRYLKSQRPPPPRDRSPEAIAARKRLADVFHLKGELYRDQGEIDQALAAWKVALDLNPAHVEAMVAAADAIRERGQAERAASLLLHANKLRPADPNIKNKLGTAYLALGKTELAAEAFRQALRIRPDWYPAANNLAWLLATSAKPRLQNGAEAVRLVEPLVARLGQARPELLDTLAAAYARAGRFEQAVATAERALALARSADTPGLAEKIQRRLDAYRQGRPWTAHDR